MPLKNPPTSRQWKLLSTLKESPGGVTLQALATRLNVDARTIRRDLKMLSEHNVPIRESTEAHGRKLWSITEKPFISTFNFEEVAALYLGHRFLSPLVNSFLWEAAEHGLQKIRQQLGTECVRLLDQLLEVFHESTTGWSDYSQQSEIISTLILACEDKKETLIPSVANVFGKRIVGQCNNFTLVDLFGKIADAEESVAVVSNRATIKDRHLIRRIGALP